jgi:hypothetical protein
MTVVVCARCGVAIYGEHGDTVVSRGACGECFQRSMLTFHISQQWTAADACCYAGDQWEATGDPEWMDLAHEAALNYLASFKEAVRVMVGGHVNA